MYHRIARVVAAVSTRVFIGEELTENEEWLNTTIGYTMNVFEAANTINAITPWKRLFYYKSLPAYQRMQVDEAAALRLITPVIKARRESMAKPGWVKRMDMTQWMLDARIKHDYKSEDYEYLSHAQLQLSVAAIHTTSMALTNMIYDLVAKPELMTVIRDELKEALASNKGEWSGALMHGLQKTDSIMKESQRHQPVGFSKSSHLHLCLSCCRQN